MHAKSTASRSAKALIIVAALVSSAVVSPDSYHDMRVKAPTNTSVASSTTPNASISSYHDM